MERWNLAVLPSHIGIGSFLGLMYAKTLGDTAGVREGSALVSIVVVLSNSAES